MNERVAVLLASLVVMPGIALGLAALTAACLGRASASLRHRVWAAGLIVTLALPALRFTVPPLRLHLPVAERARPDDDAAGATRRLDGETRGSDALPLTSIGGRRTDVEASIDWATTFTLVWLAGFVVLGARVAMSHRRARRIAVRSRPVADESLHRRSAGVVHSPFRRAPELRVSGDVGTPVVIGIARPVVILPESSVGWTNEELDAVLTHELGHVERWDTGFTAFAQIACAVYWCNPLVWLAAAAMVREAERACDDRVVRGGAEPESYARLLLRFAAAARVESAPPVAATAMARTSEVETRLLAVLDPTIRRDGSSRWFDTLLAGIASVVAITSAAIRVDAATARERIPPASIQAPANSEPDRRADSVASPVSERVPFVASDARVRTALAAALVGPDSSLAATLQMGLTHRPAPGVDLVAERSVWALAQERRGQLVAPLLDSLGSRDWRVQAYAAWALAYARTDGVDARITPLLSHPVWRVRAMAASVLRGTRNAAAQPAYERALRDDAWQVRTAAVEHFATLRDPGMIDQLRQLSNDRHIAVRRAVAAALEPR